MSTEYYLIRKEAVPEVLRKVALVNRMLACREAKTIAEAVEKVGISRSSYYKFRDDVEEFHDINEGTSVTLLLDIFDEPGVLSDILKVIATEKASILTIHQSVPMNGVAQVSISIQLPGDAGSMMKIVDGLKALEGVRKLQITGRQGREQ